MAQATDLPDPIHNNPSGGNNADDLLAQLAGAEVDRLLSEADAEALHPTNVDRAPDAGVEAVGSMPVDGTEAELDDLFAQIDEAQVAVAQKAPVDPAVRQRAEVGGGVSIEEAISQRARDLIEQAKREAGDAVGLEAAASQELQEPSAADALAAEMEEDEQAHLAALLRISPTSVATEPEALIDEAQVESLAAEQAAEEPESPTPPLVVRVLEWLNAPLSSMSTQARAALGKVALVTTLNALGILVYVLVFRRH